MKKVLFIAFYFNQENEIASKRLRGIAKYLPEFGFEPIIIAPKLNNKENLTNDFKIIETDYTDLLDKYLPNKSNDTQLQKQNKNTNSLKNKLFKKGISLAGEIFAYPDGMKYWYSPATQKASEIIKNDDICGIISSSWPITSHIIAHDLKKKYNIPWIADLRDLWNLNPYISHTFIRNYFEKKLEKNTFQNANALTTTSKLAASTLKTLHPNKKIVPIVSGYDTEDFKDNSLKKAKNNKLKLLYAGSLYNGKRDPSFLFESVNQLIKEKKIDPLKIAIDFYGDKDNLYELSKKYNISNIVNVCGKISNKEVLQKQKEADILLLISWMNKKEKMFIPGKIYEYMGSKKPVLSIGYKEGSLKDLIKQTRIGYHVSNLEESKIAIYNYYKEYINNNTIRYYGNSEEYTMKNTAKNFAKLLSEECN